MWRAYLADGRVVDHDGHNSPQHFLDQIVRFDLFTPRGLPLARLDPGPEHRLVFRWVRETNGVEQRTAGVKVGLYDRSTGELDCRFLNADTGQWSPTDDVVLTDVETG